MSLKSGNYSCRINFNRISLHYSYTQLFASVSHPYVIVVGYLPCFQMPHLFALTFIPLRRLVLWALRVRCWGVLGPVSTLPGVGGSRCRTASALSLPMIRRIRLREWTITIWHTIIIIKRKTSRLPPKILTFRLHVNHRPTRPYSVTPQTVHSYRLLASWCHWTGLMAKECELS